MVYSLEVDPVKVIVLDVLPMVTLTTLVPEGTEAFNPMFNVPVLLSLK